MRKTIILIGAWVLAFVPVLVSAASDYVFPSQNGDIGDVILWAIRILNLLIYLIVAFAVVTFLWGVAQTILHGGEQEARKKGRELMIYGIIGLAVMLGFWSIVGFVGHSFGISTGVVPQFNATSGTVTGGNAVGGTLSSPGTSAASGGGSAAGGGTTMTQTQMQQAESQQTGGGSGAAANGGSTAGGGTMTQEEMQAAQSQQMGGGSSAGTSGSGSGSDICSLYPDDPSCM